MRQARARGLPAPPTGQAWPVGWPYGTGRPGCSRSRPEGTYADERTAPYLDGDLRALRFTLLRHPAREELVVPVVEQLVVEHYSR
ncbi:hypothetical protein ABZ860_05110 [Microbispora sp. NPDC046973]|uniref:hypothetical protein n=1 Tax=Microbispora sp. NPDC046973 TaxID=3155022 RepID=UPI0033CB7858